MNRNGHTTLPPDSSLAPVYTQNTWVFPAADPSPHKEPLTIKLPSFNMANTRGSTRLRANSNASGSEYHTSNASMDVDDHDAPAEDDEEESEPKPEFTKSSRGRQIQKKSYVESSENSNDENDDQDELDVIDQKESTAHEDDDEEQPQPTRPQTRSMRNGLNGAVISDDDGETQLRGYRTRAKKKVVPSAPSNSVSNKKQSTKRKSGKSNSGSATRSSARRLRSQPMEEQDGTYVDEPENSGSGDESADDVAETSELEPLPKDAETAGDADVEGEPDEQGDRPYALRTRNKVNYAVLPPIEEMAAPPQNPRTKARNGRSHGGSRPKLGWSMTGAQLDRWLGGNPDDSVSPSGLSVWYTQQRTVISLGLRCS
jgi:ATPase family AAA domain-containing protein 2